MSNHLRAGIRAELRDPNLRAELALRKRAEALIDAQVSLDADRARRYLDQQKGQS